MFSDKKQVLFAAATVVSICAGCLLLSEITMRLLLADRLEDSRDERSLAYRHDARLGWFPREGSSSEFTGSRTVSVRHNSHGFRDEEFLPKTRPRIAFLGDSFVWGYDVQEEERFTEKLQVMIPDWEVLNLGVSGFGTDQEFLLLQSWYDMLRPDIVFLVYTAGSDDLDNVKVYNYGGYFKPYYYVRGDTLELRGVPAPKGAYYHYVEHPMLFRSYFARSIALGLDRARRWGEPMPTRNPTVYILEEMKEFLQARDTQLAIGFHGYTDVPFGDKEREFCDQLGIPCLDLSNQMVYPDKSNHWTPEGHDLVAGRIYRFLNQQQPRQQD
jgi:hypothetical protein